MIKYMIHQCLHGSLMQNGTDKNLVRIFDHWLTVGFLVANNSEIKIWTVTEELNQENNKNSP